MNTYMYTSLKPLLLASNVNTALKWILPKIECSCTPRDNIGKQLSFPSTFALLLYIF